MGLHPPRVQRGEGVARELLRSELAVSECPDCPDLGLFHESGGSTWGVNKGEKPRFVVLEDVKGQTVTIVVETSVLGLAEFLLKAQKVVDSVKWTGS